MEYGVNVLAVKAQETDETTDIRFSRVLDDLSYRASEVDRLERSVAVQTSVGKAALHDLVLDGAGSKAQILARQEAIEELGSHPTLVETLTKGLAEFAKYETSVREFSARDDRAKSYKSTTKAMAGLKELVKAVEGDGLETPESTFLTDNIRALSEFSDTALAKKLRGPLYYTPFGLRGREELHWFSPRMRFRPGFSGRLGILAAAGMYAGKHGAISPDLAMIATMIPGMGFYTTMENTGGYRLKDGVWSLPTTYRGLRKRIAKTPEYTDMFTALGKLDTVVALNGLRQTIESHGHRTVFPDIEETGLYHFEAEEMKNPLLALEAGRTLVANSIELGGEERRLSFLSGPNSGGKSTLTKAIVQNQVLGQLGSSVVARRASMTIADNIAYHVPMPPNLEDETGRFGFELARVSSILRATTERSLTTLDDCLDGTTHEERVAVLKNVMLAFRNFGGATLFSTHAHELISQFEEHQVGQFLQVEFEDGSPTYRLVPGVSHTSHAERVAELYDFNADQIKERMRVKGIVDPVWF